MSNILQTIAAHTRERVASAQLTAPLAEVAERAQDMTDQHRAVSSTVSFPFEQALSEAGMSFICECKRASPSRGVIVEHYDPCIVACAYAQAGAAAVSVLTEPYWFGGASEHLVAVSQSVDIPTLRKDFVVDAYQIYEARLLGASAVLLICSILDDEQLASYIALAHELGMSALVEAYEPEEVPRALAAGARVVGVNNRDLKTFSVDFGRSIDLRPLVGPDRLFVSESGVKTRADVERLEQAGVDGVLIGETLMRATDTGAALAALRG